MDRERWARIQALFHEAADLPREEQLSFLNSACGDASLVEDVQAMLVEDARSNSLLDREMAEVVHEILSGPAGDYLPKQNFGPYKVKSALGEGGMGVVYLAERADLGSLAAIKVLRDAWLSPARRDRFASEQRTLAQLTHPSIARLYDADTSADGTPWFAMEYVEGVTLTSYCADHRSSVEQRLRLMLSVCEAVQYAHQHAVIHRDLKPSNILVKPDGTIRLLDFGIAKQIEALDTSVDKTMTVLRLMTPAYAAPEQIRGDRVGIQTDVYSLGVILYELLSGKLPFDLSTKTPGEAEELIMHQDPERPSLVWNGAAKAGKAAMKASKAEWDDLDVLCLTAMRKEPERRYSSVEALIRDIEHYLKREPLEARPDRLSYRLGKFVRRHRNAVAVSAAVVALVVGLVGFFTVRLARARNAAVSEAARAQRIQRFTLKLFQGGDEAAGPADDLRVVSLLDRGVQEAHALESEPQVQAEMYLTLGGIYQNLGKLDQAERLLQLSLDQRKSLFGADHPAVAESLIGLGLLRDAQARYDEAEDMVRNGLEMTKRHLSATHPAVAKATSSLGRVLEDRGEYDKAISTLEEAVRLQSGPDASRVELASSLTELANCNFYAGRYDVSDALNRRVIEIDRKLYGEKHPSVANDLINLGATQFERGHYPEAERYYRQAFEIIGGFYGKDNPETASAQTMLARALVSQNHLEEASGLLKEALRIQEKVYGAVHPRVASALNELGKVALQSGKYDEAEAEFERMAEIYRKIYSGKHYLIGVALSNLGTVETERKRFADAERNLREALHMFEQTLPADHVNFGITRVKLGRVLLRERRYRDAEVESRTGLDILAKQNNPSMSWIQKGRQDLAVICDNLREPAKAAGLRELMHARQETDRK
jgi:serine/threonine-protein kinase